MPLSIRSLLHLSLTLTGQWVECSPMIRETEVQSQVELYQRLKKWHLMLPCLTLSTIMYRSRVKCSNPGNGVAPSPTLQWSSYWKGKPSGRPRLRSPTLLTCHKCCYFCKIIISLSLTKYPKSAALCLTKLSFVSLWIIRILDKGVGNIYILSYVKYFKTNRSANDFEFGIFSFLHYYTTSRKCFTVADNLSLDFE